MSLSFFQEVTVPRWRDEYHV
jgi:hypothetical protein